MVVFSKVYKVIIRLFVLRLANRIASVMGLSDNGIVETKTPSITLTRRVGWFKSIRPTGKLFSEIGLKFNLSYHYSILLV